MLITTLKKGLPLYYRFKHNSISQVFKLVAMKNILWLTTILASFALLLSFQTKADLSFLDMTQDNFSAFEQERTLSVSALSDNGNYELPECVEIETEEVKETKENYHNTPFAPRTKAVAYIYTNYLPDNFIQFNINQNNSCLSQGLYLLFHSLVFYE